MQPRPPTRDDDPDPDLIELGILVRRWRRSHYLSQRRFGEKVGLDQSSISRLENGRLPGLLLYRTVPLLRTIGLLPSPPKRPDPLLVQDVLRELSRE